MAVRRMLLRMGLNFELKQFIVKFRELVQMCALCIAGAGELRMTRALQSSQKKTSLAMMASSDKPPIARLILGS